MQAAMGAKGIVEPSFVYLPGITGGGAVQKSVQGLDYFSINLELGVISKVKFADDRSTVLTDVSSLSPRLDLEPRGLRAVANYLMHIYGPE
jgi:hypothetical protein